MRTEPEMAAGRDEFPTTDFLGLKLAAITTAEFLALLVRNASRREKPFLVGYLNAATVNLAFEMKPYGEILKLFDCLYADGQAVVWGSRWRGEGVPERINAGDFTGQFALDCMREGLRLALVGGRPGEAEGAARQFTRWAPDLKIVYSHHGFFDEVEEAGVFAELERADPDLVLVGMGSPRQERWVLERSRRGRPRAWWCVGALFEYYSGTRWRAPRWIRRMGLEWAFRLALEPRRLWKRYLVGNPRFIWRTLRGQAIE